MSMEGCLVNLFPSLDLFTGYVEFPMAPLEMGALSSLGMPQPVGFSFAPGPAVIGRNFYGSVFYPFFPSPLSRWGDDWYAYDKLFAGARLLSWGNAITDTDPFVNFYRSPYYFSGGRSLFPDPDQKVASLDFWRDKLFGKV